MKAGRFYAVGVGPGDPELMTLKAIHTIERCHIIAAPRTRDGKMLAWEIASAAMDLSGKTLLPLSFVMKREADARESAYADAVQQVTAQLDAGNDVAMLNLGDVSIYATGSYILERVKALGYETQMIPGVPSFCAVAAALDQSLTEMNAPLHILPGGIETLSDELALPGGKVLMKSGKQLSHVISALQEAGQLERASMVSDCGLPTEAIYHQLDDLPNTPGYFSTIIVKP